MTFCGVGAHHQNAVVESKNKKSMLWSTKHAKRKWPTVISIILWPYAVHCLVERNNRLSLDEHAKGPLEK